MSEETNQRRTLQKESINIFPIMEDINEKLKILNYETEFLRKR
jgi:hypothetical protein